MPQQTPTEDEINEVLNQCDDANNAGTSKFRGMSFEDGVAYAIRWMQGDGPNPMDD